MSHCSGHQDRARSRTDRAPVLSDSDSWEKRQTMNECIMCKGVRAGRMSPSGYGAAMVGREVILDRWSQKFSQEEKFEQRPACNEGKSHTACESRAL